MENRRSLGARVKHSRLPRHVWVDGDPGLLLEWRRDGSQWWGRVVSADPARHAVEAWVRADHLQPADPAPPAGDPVRPVDPAGPG